MVRVKLFATLRDITGKREIEVHDVSSVKELLAYLYDEYGEEFKKEIEEKNMILVNGHNILDGDGYDTKLKEEDEVAIFPPVGGG